VPHTHWSNTEAEEAVSSAVIVGGRSFFMKVSIFPNGFALESDPLGKFNYSISGLLYWNVNAKWSISGWHFIPAGLTQIYVISNSIVVFCFHFD
jgi:hypothetical protein